MRIYGQLSIFLHKNICCVSHRIALAQTYVFMENSRKFSLNNYYLISILSVPMIYPMFPDLVSQPFVQLKIFSSWRQAGQIYHKCKWCSIQQHRQRLEILSHVQNPRQPCLIMWLSTHVPLSHGVHDECSYCAGVALAMPCIVEDHGRVLVIAEKQRHQVGDQFLF